MLTVFNVGQGDSFLLKPDNRCTFDKIPLLIDCGSKGSLKGKSIENHLHLMLTHSHMDHIGGFPDILKQGSLDTLFIPYYLPEITKIINYLSKYLPPSYGSVNWANLPGVKRIVLVAEGMDLCNHCVALNPPIRLTTHYGAYFTGEGNIQEALSGLREMGIELPTEEILHYRSPLEEREKREDFTIVDPAGAYWQGATQCVHTFFISLYNRLRLNREDDKGYHIASHVALTANQASIVFLYTHTEFGRLLMTGDADTYVFRRLLKAGASLQAEFLKIPHHGSRENMSSDVLDAIQPSVAIVSHGNRKFGLSTDPHPHHEVIDLLDIKHIETHYTNDVIKNGQVIKAATQMKNIRGGVISFQ